MIQDKYRVYDGLLSAGGGVDSGHDTGSIDKDQLAFAVNVTVRGDFPDNRPPYERLILTFESAQTETRWNTGKYQGSCTYTGGDGIGSLIVAKGGRLFKVLFLSTENRVLEITIHLNEQVTVAFIPPAVGASITIDVLSEVPFSVGDHITISGGGYLITQILNNQLVVTYGGGSTVTPVPAGTPILEAGVPVVWEDVNPDDEFAYLFQAERFCLVGQGEMQPIIHDGATTRRSTDLEIPPFFCGAEVMGRIWFAFPNRTSYGATNLVGSVGTTLAELTSAILIYFGPDAENTYLNEGGEFSVPAGAGLITCIGTTAVLDTSLGQGAVSIYCTNGVFTNNSPVDRTIWKDVTFPIQTVALLDYGSLSARGVVNVNADAWYRSQDGIRSFIIARRNFNQGWGNSAMSHEVDRILEYDTAGLLEFGSAVMFDNRLLMTVSPHRVTHGIVHRGLAVINFDNISTLRTKGSPAWEGLWNGLDIFQIIRSRIDLIERCFFLVDNGSDEMELWELQKDGAFDLKYCTDSEGKLNVVTERIQSIIETRSMSFDNSNSFELKQLTDGELAYDEVQGCVDFVIKTRPDDYPAWVDYDAWQECYTMNRCTTECPDLRDFKPGYDPCHVMQVPKECCLPGTPRTSNMGYAFQFKIIWTGKARIKQFRVHATRQLDNPPMR